MICKPAKGSKRRILMEKTKNLRKQWQSLRSASPNSNVVILDPKAKEELEELISAERALIAAEAAFQTAWAAFVTKKIATNGLSDLMRVVSIERHGRDISLRLNCGPEATSLTMLRR